VSRWIKQRKIPGRWNGTACFDVTTMTRDQRWRVTRSSRMSASWAVLVQTIA